MKKYLLIAASILFAAPAFAAPKPAMKPKPPPAPIYLWTGFYVGGNVGASFGVAKTELNQAPGTSTFTNKSGISPSTIPGFAQPDDERYPGRFMGGGQIGYNWQVEGVGDIANL